MADLPKTICVAGISIKILRQDLSDDDCYGYWQNDKKAIILDTRLTGKRLLETLRHELLHAALDLSGVSFIETKGYPEEATVRALENLFFPPWERIVKRLSK
mgnify:CR=1 FL=1|tara:strand:+ start:2312 stop:2617 length:306 start_codon:yes stop_codon:yes gene_type:complete